MITINLKGQLGNQMFQYAAARVQAERIGCRLIVEPSKNSRKKNILAAFTSQPNFEIFRVFPELSVSRFSNVLAGLSVLPKDFELQFVNSICKNYFTPQRTGFDLNEGYDGKIWEVEKNTRLDGYFQSEKYFKNQRNEVLNWFHPSTDSLRNVKKLQKTLPTERRNLIGVHVRLGDYVKLKGVHSDEKTGWALCKSYYSKALEQFPSTMPIALFSDDPIAAVDLLPRKPEWVSPVSSPPATDLFLMSSIPNLVLSNSTFSWWAGWLNTNKHRVIFAPKYHIGWRKKIWYPKDIFVEQWTYI